MLLKAVALPRRAGAHRAEKVISDTQDLVALVTRQGLDALVAEVRAAPADLLAHAGQVLAKRCGETARIFSPRCDVPVWRVSRPTI